jgi:hypothetical protein
MVKHFVEFFCFLEFFSKNEEERNDLYHGSMNSSRADLAAKQAASVYFRVEGGDAGAGDISFLSFAGSVLFRRI